MPRNASLVRRWVGLILFLVLLGLGAITYVALSQPPPSLLLTTFLTAALVAWNA